MSRWRELVLVNRGGSLAPTLALIAANFLFAVFAQVGFKLSADIRTLRTFLLWQAAGNLSGFLGVLALTWLLRYLPLHVAFPLTTGLAVIGVQVLAAWWLFQEPIALRQWIGTLFIILGIFFIGGR